ncbi:hypothetical protein SAMN04488544_1788 [Microlunatus sagamiharensis]|uniref:Uncharacterized protein n=1 Tax=Microlunatus sagamiharensis TaxID=546874 RepID=A0A1H2MC59_9ACTN|nr:hypothetical protein SAMN04488544_1788 [Microlunatus sagamiharensis]
MAEARPPVAEARPPVAGRLGAFVRGVVVQTVVTPVREGRIRDVGWPYGLRAVVPLGYVAFGLAAVLVVASTAIRRHAVLGPSASLPSGLPEPAVWMLATLFSFGLSLLLVAGLRSPWWLRLLALLVVLAALSLFALRTPGTAGSVVWPLLVLVLLAALVVLVVVRARRRFSWWELAVTWALVGAGLVVGLVAMLAGAAAAEVCVRLTVAATRQAQRLARRWVPFAVLGVVVVVRGVQVGLQVVGLDPVTQGGDVVAASLVLVGLLAGVGVALLAVARRRGSRPDVEGLGDELSGVGLPVGAALVLVVLPVQLLAGLVPVLGLLGSRDGFLGSGLDPAALVARLVDPVRAVVGLVVVGLGFRAARQGRATRALLLGSVGVLLLMLARSLVQGPEARAGVDPDVLNLVATAVVVVGGLVSLVRRRLDRSRALALAGALTLCALFSSRDFVSDPVGAVLGFSGAALVLFGLTWDLFTGSLWANQESRRFARPTRVLLVLANSVVTMSVLAFAALVRDGSTTIYLDPYAAFGDLIFGTALLAAAVVGVLAPAPRTAAVAPVSSVSSGSSTSQPQPV